MQQVGKLWNGRRDVELRLLGYAAEDFELAACRRRSQSRGECLKSCGTNIVEKELKAAYATRKSPAVPAPRRVLVCYCVPISQ
jgi:hypothetical protein